jgi:hypothetical protein
VISGADSNWYLVVKTCTNWTHACQLNAENLAAWVKYRTRLLEFSSYSWV